MVQSWFEKMKDPSLCEVSEKLKIMCMGLYIAKFENGLVV